MTSQGTAHGRFSRAIASGNLRNAEDAAYELGTVALDDALQLLYLYGEASSPKYERAALRWLERYLIEDSPSLLDFAHMTVRLAKAAQVRV